MTTPEVDRPRWRRALAPGLLALHLVAVAGIVFCVLMGFWQLGVYDNRQLDEQADRREVPTVPLADVLGPDDPFTGSANERPVTIEGAYAGDDAQWWVEGRASGSGEDGYWLLAAYRVEGTDAAIALVRGWSADADTPPPVPSGTTPVEAVVEPSESGGALSAYDAGAVLETINVPALVNAVPYDLWSAYAVVTTPVPDGAAGAGLSAPEVPRPEVSWTVGLSNLVYAVEWWTFAVFAAYMWWRMTRDLLRGRDERAEAEASAARQKRGDQALVGHG